MESKYVPLTLLIDQLSQNFHFEKHIKDEKSALRDMLEYRDIFSRLF